MSPCFQLILLHLQRESHLERCQQTNSEKRLKSKLCQAEANRRSDGTKQNCQANLLIKSGVEILNALKHKANQSDQHR